MEQPLTAGAGLVSEYRFDTEVPSAKGYVPLQTGLCISRGAGGLLPAVMGNVTCKQKNIRFTY